MKAKLRHGVDHVVIGLLIFLTGAVFRSLHDYHHQAQRAK